MPRRIAIALLGLSGGLVTARALAEPATALTLRWQAPAGCPQQAEVKERIRALTGTTRPQPRVCWPKAPSPRPIALTFISGS